MVKSAKSHHDDEDEPDGYDSSSYRGTYIHKMLLFVLLFFSLNFDFIIGELAKVDGSSSEQKLNTHRSKHSETEQRRRSKINERKAYFFQ